MRWRSLIVGAAVVCAWLGQIAAAGAAHVQAKLVADVSAVAPGKAFWVGVQLTVDPGWHIYWTNPGDAGLPTRVKLTAPAGFTVGPLLYPTPWRFDQAGGIVAYGYEKSVLLMAKVTPPGDLPADSRVEIGAAVSWLVCSSVCIPGKDHVNLTLGVSSSPAADNAELFDAWRAQSPVEAADSPDVAGIDATSHSGADGLAVSVVIRWKEAVPDSIQFFPGILESYNISGMQGRSSDGKTTITFTAVPLAGKSPGATTLEAVVGYNNKEGEHRGVRVAIALPAASAAE